MFVIKQLTDFWKGRGILFVKYLNGNGMTTKDFPENLKILKVESFDDLASLTVNEDFKKRIRRNLAPGKEVFVGILDDKVVNTSFIDFEYPAGTILFGDFTLPEFRGRHINSAVKTFIFNLLKKKGIKKVYISCAKNNISSKASILRAGFRELNFLERIQVRLKKWEKKIRHAVPD